MTRLDESMCGICIKLQKLKYYENKNIFDDWNI